MPNYIYKVSSFVTVKGESDHSYFELVSQNEHGDSICPKKLLVSLDNVELGEMLELSFNKINQNVKKEQKIAFLHHFDRSNQGDIKSGPYNYFHFGNYQQISWDQSILKNKILIGNDPETVIMGGGIYFTKDKPRMSKLVKKAKNFIGWGIGLDSRVNLDDFISSFTILGTREKYSEYIDNVKTFYVPCSSCMHDVFDDFLSPEKRQESTVDIAIHLNNGFNEKLISSKFKNYNITYTTDPFDKIITNLSSADCIITNSYHGAYWGALMGKKIVCINTEVPKWDGLHENTVFSKVEELEASIKLVKAVPLSYIQECRLLNEQFYAKVMRLIHFDHY